MNNVNMIGRLARDPELRYTANGTAVCNLTVAVDTSEQDGVAFLNVVIWGKAGESTAEYCRKGREVAITGELRTRSWESDDGTKRYATEIHTNSCTWLREPQGSREPAPDEKPQGSNNRNSGRNTSGRNRRR